MPSLVLFFKAAHENNEVGSTADSGVENASPPA
jgi:hypothetical protein